MLYFPSDKGFYFNMLRCFIWKAVSNIILSLLKCMCTDLTNTPLMEIGLFSPFQQQQYLCQSFLQNKCLELKLISSRVYNHLISLAIFLICSQFCIRAVFIEPKSQQICPFNFIIEKVEQVFICLLTICKPSSVNCLFMTCTCTSPWLLVIQSYSLLSFHYLSRLLSLCQITFNQFSQFLTF